MQNTNYQIIENPNHEKLLDGQPQDLYKYLDWNNVYNRKVLEDNELFFSSPRNFNDPFDCKIEKRYDLMSDEEVDLYFENLVHLESEYNNRNWDEIKIKSEIERLKKENNLKDLEKMNSDNLFQFSQNDNFYAIFCTSKKWDSIPMWAYYANSHKGICINFDLRKIFYSGKVGGGKCVSYDEYPILKPSQSFEEKSDKQIYFKSKDWKHEEEYRLMTLNMPKHGSNIMLDNDGNLKGIKIIADDNWYKEIILGINTTDETISEIVKAAKNKLLAGTKLYKMKRVNFEFKMNKYEIDFKKFL